MFTLSIESGKKVSDRSLSTLELLGLALTASGRRGWKIWKGSSLLAQG